jgi:acetylornithine deacetylase/succinyl-diaminopimelate desuccinylase-like protein
MSSRGDDEHMTAGETDIHARPAELLQRLIRFDTTNPPGNEKACIAWVGELLRGVGCDSIVRARDPERPNLVARIEGGKAAPPLLLQGHVDVVSTARQRWSHPPFEGQAEGGYVWGRGALDMKGGVAMMLAAFMRAKTEGAALPGDVILCLMSDEEAGSDLGARYLVDEHADLFEGVRYALGEFGGFSMDIAGRSFYPIMVAEKQLCWTRARVRGPGGHGSLPIRGGAMAKLGRFLLNADRRRLPAHVTPVARQMIEAIADALPSPVALPVRALLRPSLTDRTLGLIGERGRIFDPLLHNTANATIVNGGEKINVVPAEIELELDCRLLPGFGPEDLFRELRPLAGEDVELEVIRYDEYPAQPDMALFDTLGEILRELAPTARPMPLLLPGVTDARFFARLGIQTYGFLPMKLPKELGFMQLIHAADERIPTDSLEFGTQAIQRALERFGARG